MGWLPESGFIQYRWDVYAEMLTMLLMAIGASRNAIPPTAWNAVTRPIIEFGGIEFISGVAPLFIHQYAHACAIFDICAMHMRTISSIPLPRRGHINSSA